MPEGREAVNALIARLVRESNLPDARARDDLRRELESHFADAGTAPEALRAALERFGSPAEVTDGFRRAHRRGRAALHAAKVLASVVVASAAALVLQVPVNLRLAGASETPVRLGSGYLVSALFSVFIVAVLVAAWELDIEPLCARLERHPLRVLAAFGALSGTIYVGHPVVHGAMGIHGPVDVSLLVLGGAAGVAVWASAVAIIARIDVAFVSLFGPRMR